MTLFRPALLLISSIVLFRANFDCFSMPWSRQALVQMIRNRKAIIRGDDLDKTTLELIEENGYAAEEHTVVTADGYILVLHRIPNTNNIPESDKLPVLLQHGLLSSSSDWVMQPQHRSLAYILADQGYDVWMGNARGNTYSRRHVNISSDQPEFWKFTWNEMGKFDLPSVIDFILERTTKRQLFYVGHSMGTTMFWVMMHHHPEFNDKIRKMHALAPIAKVTHMRSAVRVIAPFANNIEVINEWFGRGRFMPGHGWLEVVAKYFCQPNELTQVVCDNLVFVLAGSDSRQLNTTALPVILSHTPAGTSTRTVVHYAQEVVSDEFCQYDWGGRENLRRYGHVKPPRYDLSKVTCPVLLYTADNDILAVKEDIDWLADRLINLKFQYRVPFKKFNHVDFMWAKDADRLLYSNLVNHIRTS